MLPPHGDYINGANPAVIPASHKMQFLVLFMFVFIYKYDDEQF